MINTFKDIESFFREMDNVLYKKVEVYIIGGAALLRRGQKAATKDIDIIVSTKNEFIEIQNTLIKVGFKTNLPGKEYSRMNLSQIFQKEDFRIDLFEKEVCGKFSLSENMKNRAEIILNLKHIKVFICSNEDILLFKTMTERDGDIDDCVSIATTQTLEWNIILEELQNQIKESKQNVWITWIGERLDLLIERGIDIPIMEKVNGLREKFFDDLEKMESKR